MIQMMKYVKLVLGPMGIPILGNILTVGNALHLAFMKYLKQYGPIFRIKLCLNE